MKTLLTEIKGREFFVLDVLLILTICFIQFSGCAPTRSSVTIYTLSAPSIDDNHIQFVSSNYG